MDAAVAIDASAQTHATLVAETRECSRRVAMDFSSSIVDGKSCETKTLCTKCGSAGSAQSGFLQKIALACALPPNSFTLRLLAPWNPWFERNVAELEQPIFDEPADTVEMSQATSRLA
jgi:hypothetical protein